MESDLGNSSLRNRWNGLRDRLGLGLGLGLSRLGDGLLQSGDDSLQLFQTAILLLDFAAQSLDLIVDIGTILVGLGKIPVGRIISALDTSGGKRVGTEILQFVGALPRHVDHDLRTTVVGVHVATSQMFSKVLLARESIARASVAVGVGAHQWLLGVGILLVHLALVAQETTGVGEALNLVTARFVALVGTIMFIHMFAGSSRVSMGEIQP